MPNNQKYLNAISGKSCSRVNGLGSNVPDIPKFFGNTPLLLEGGRLPVQETQNKIWRIKGPISLIISIILIFFFFFREPNLLISLVVFFGNVKIPPEIDVLIIFKIFDCWIM